MQFLCFDDASQFALDLAPLATWRAPEIVFI